MAAGNTHTQLYLYVNVSGKGDILHYVISWGSLSTPRVSVSHLKAAIRLRPSRPLWAHSCVTGSNLAIYN